MSGATGGADGADTGGAGSGMDRPHVWRAGPGAPPLLLLHGTGGDEHDLIPLADRIAPDSPVLSPRGTVLEHGAPRFFRRHSEGVFDEADLRQRCDELAAFITTAQQVHEVRPGSWVAVGFSNGANMASAMLFTHPDLLAGAVLFAAMVPFSAGPGDVDLGGKRVAVVNGRLDPMATPAVTSTLTAQLRERGAAVTEIAYPGGHTIDAATLPEVLAFLVGLRSTTTR